MKEKPTFIKHLKLWSVVFLVSLGFVLSGHEVFEYFQICKASAEQMKTDILIVKKNILKNEVNHVVNLINYKLEKNGGLDKESEEELLEIISRIRFGKEGYIFVNRFNGNALVSNGKVFSDSEKLWEKFSANSEKMKKIFNLEYKAAQKKDGDFIYYTFFKLTNSKKQSPKLSYIYGIKELNWLIGAGVYLNDVDNEVLLLQNDLKKQVRAKLFFTVLIIVVMILFFILLLKVFSWKFENDFNQINKFFKEVIKKNKAIDLSKIQFLEFEEMAKNANSMLLEKIQAQEALLLSEQKYRLFLENNGAIILIVNPKNATITFANNSAVKFYGYKKEELIGMHMSKINIMPPEEIKKKMARSLKEEKNYFNFKHRLANGEIKDVEIYQTKFVVRNETFFSIIIHDISKRVKAENELIKSESKFRALFHGINDAVLVLPIDKGFNNFVEVNDAAIEYLGYSRDELLNMTLRDLDLEYNSQERSFWDIRRELMENGSVVFGVTHISKSGEKTHVEVSSHIFKMDDKKYIIALGRDITERKKSEQKFLENQYFFKLITENAYDFIWTMDMNLNITYATDSVFKLLGYTKEEIKEVNLNELFSEDDFRRIQGIFEEALKNENLHDGIRFNINPKRKGGTTFPAEIQAKIIYNEDGLPIYIQGYTRDITEQFEAEKKILASNERYSRLADLTYEGILIHKNGVVFDVNKAFVKISGYSFKEIVGKNVLKELVPKEYHHVVIEMMKVPVTPAYQIEAIRKDGSLLQVEIESRNFKSQTEDSELRVTAIRDITKRKQIEDDLRKFKLGIEQSAEIVFMTQIDGTITYVNPAFEETYGFNKEEAIGKTPRIFKSGFYGKKFYRNYWNKLLNKEIVSGEIVNKTKDGRFITLSGSVNPILDENNEILGFLTIQSDVTKQKQEEKELREAKEQAENADRMKSIFLAQMSHEIRTPINALVSMSSLLRYDFEDAASEDQLTSFDIIDRAGGRIIRTVDLILNLSEIQAGTYQPSPEKFNLYSDILSLIVVENKKVVQKKGIALSLIPRTKETEMVADTYTINQIFYQLIDNAIKYTNEGSIKVILDRDEDDKLYVEISDTGIGIDEAYLPDLFEPFTQEEMGYTRKYEGNGIGLALVKKYCELNNAEIIVESKKGFGSIFRVVFN